MPAFYFNTGTDFVDRPAGWGEQQINAYTDTHYHQPSDEFSDDWSLEGMIEDARFGFWAGLAVANSGVFPAWNAGNEFEVARNAALAELGIEHRKGRKSGGGRPTGGRPTLRTAQS